MVATGFFIKYLQSFNIRILILSCTWALLGSSFLIISLTFLTEISIDVKTDLMSCKSCWQLAIIDKGRALHCKIWIKELSLWLNYRYKSVVMLYWWYTRYFYHSVMFLEGINIFQDWDFYHKLTWHILVRLIDFCVDGILNR